MGFLSYLQKRDAIKFLIVVVCTLNIIDTFTMQFWLNFGIGEDTFFQSINGSVEMISMYKILAVYLSCCLAWLFKESKVIISIFLLGLLTYSIALLANIWAFVEILS